MKSGMNFIFRSGQCISDDSQIYSDADSCLDEVVKVVLLADKVAPTYFLDKKLFGIGSVIDRCGGIYIVKDADFSYIKVKKNTMLPLLSAVFRGNGVPVSGCLEGVQDYVDHNMENFDYADVEISNEHVVNSLNKNLEDIRCRAISEFWISVTVSGGGCFLCCASIRERVVKLIDRGVYLSVVNIR